VVSASPSAANKASPSTVQKSSATSASAVSRVDDVKVLGEILQKMKSQNHFEVLEVPRSVDGATLKAAYLKLARQFHPDTVLPGTPESVAVAKASIFARIGDAHRTLGDVKLRGEYEAELNSGGTGEKIDVSKIFEAEEHFQKGVILVKARRFADGLKFLDSAIAANGEEPEYFAWRGFAKFFLSIDKKAAQKEVLADIDKCLNRNPRIAPAWYFKGFVSKAIGDLNQAKACFRKCVELDGNHIDANRELRALGNVK
jgi:tetratricopeptide (TPR) repeat protein